MISLEDLKSNAVVFDTNVYRSIDDVYIKKIINKESEYHIKPFVSIVAAVELISHLYDDDKNKNMCKAGLSRMSLHLPSSDSLLPFSQLQIYHSFFYEYYRGNTYIQQMEKEVHTISYMLKCFDIEGLMKNYIIENKNRITKWLYKTKKEFADMIINLKEKIEKEGKEKLKEIYPIAILKHLADKAGIQITDFEDRAKMLKKILPLTVEFIFYLLEKETLPKEDTLGNDLFDNEIAFYINKDTVVDKKIYVVTDDNRFINMVKGVYFDDRVLTKNEYLTLLDIK